MWILVSGLRSLKRKVNLFGMKKNHVEKSFRFKKYLCKKFYGA